MAAKTGLTKKDSEQTMNAMLEAPGELLSQSDRLMVSGFRTFETRAQAARTARDPRTGEPMSPADSGHACVQAVPGTE